MGISTKIIKIEAEAKKRGIPPSECEHAMIKEGLISSDWYKIKILVGIPCLYGEGHCREAIESVIHQEGVDVLLIDNGAEQSVSDLIQMYKEHQNVCVIHNKVNLFVNPAWQQILNVFLSFEEYDYLIIMNSDLIMQKDWAQVVKNRWLANSDEVLIPSMPDYDRNRSVDTNILSAQKVTEGTAGVFITLNKKQAKMCSPLPVEIKVWFGDNYFYSILRECGYDTVIPENLLAQHYTSSTIVKVPNISQIIEDDKVAWRDIVEPRMNKLIAEINSKKNE